MKIIKSTKNSTGGNVAIKAATNKNSSVRLQMKEELMDQILSEIKSKLKEIMTSYQFGYDDNEWEDYSGADIYLDNRGYIVITVYAEVSYNGLVKIMDALNPIVEKYDSDAYFDADTPGRCSAYINPDNVPSNMYPYDDIQNSEKIYSNASNTDDPSSSTILCSYDEFITWYDNLSDEEQWKVDDIADTNGIPFYEEASDDELSWLHDVATSEIHASADIVEGASNEVELDPEESMIDMNIDQYIIVDSEGSWDYDSDNYDWASSDGEGSDWYSDNGVRLDDPTGVVEKIDELIEPHVPIEPGTYRVQGYIELYYTVSGVYENRYDYTEDDYSSDINSDFGSAEYNKKLSKIENVKVTKI